MNSLGIKRGEECQHFGNILIRIFPHLASLAILMFFGMWHKSPFASPIVASETFHSTAGIALIPFLLFSFITYVLLASIFLALSKITSLKDFPIKKHFLVATITGVALYLIFSGFWWQVTGAITRTPNRAAQIFFCKSV
jgi:hypothetical protein